MKNIEYKSLEENLPVKWGANEFGFLVPLVALLGTAILGFSIAGVFNYTMNTTHLRKMSIPKENVEFFSLFRPGYFWPMYKGHPEEANLGYILKEEINQRRENER